MQALAKACITLLKNPVALPFAFLVTLISATIVYLGDLGVTIDPNRICVYLVRLFLPTPQEVEVISLYVSQVCISIGGFLPSIVA